MANAQAEEGLSDLDDIDALLEEAEQALEEAEPEVLTEADNAEADADPEPEPETEGAEPESEGAPAEEEASVDSEVSEEAPEEVAEAAEEPQTPEAQSSEPDQSSNDEVPVDAEVPSKPEPVKSSQVDDEIDEPPIPEHHKMAGQSKKKSDNELTAADMDKLKKLILAFGITTIVLLTIGLGLTLWAAIAASTTHLDEETQTLLEELKTGIEHVALKSERQDKTLEAIEKKIDALSFQLEQINGDIGKLEEVMKSQPVSSVATVQHQVSQHVSPPIAHNAPLHGGGHTGHGGGHVGHGAQPVEPAHMPVPNQYGHSAPAAPVVAKIDPALKKTLGSINSRLIRNQKKVEQVYKALRKLQTQYRVMLSMLKKIRKEIKAQQKKAETKQKTQKHEYYKYETRPYDPESIGAYP